MRSRDSSPSCALISRLRRGAPIVGAAFLLMSCSGQGSSLSEGPSPVNFADEEPPSADLSTIAANQDEATQKLQELLDQQDPSAWEANPASGRSSPGRAAAIVYESPDADPATPAAPAKSARSRSTKPKTGAASVIVDDSVSDADASAYVGVSPVVPAIDAAELTRAGAAPSASESPAKARERLVAELAGSLRKETESSGGAAIEREGLGLLALDVVQPGSVDAELDAFARGLSTAEARSFQSLRGLFRTLGDQAVAGGSTGAVLDATRLQSTLSAHASQLADGEPLLISSATLCTSVDGYGRYTPFASTTFVQGRAHPAILYLAVDHVTQNQQAAQTGGARSGAKSPGSRSTLGTIKSAVGSILDGAAPSVAGRDDGIDWAIDLTQSAVLYHDKDNLQVFSFGEQALRDVSRDRRRDFCVARRIELPASLSLGRYNLKVTVRDKGGSATAEAIIPIQIVADSTLAR